jgi:hypothetical protein
MAGGTLLMVPLLGAATGCDHELAGCLVLDSRGGEAT